MVGRHILLLATMGVKVCSFLLLTKGHHFLFLSIAGSSFKTLNRTHTNS